MTSGEEATGVDLRSDTVTQPTAAMRAAMAEAEVGDDVYREDPTVIDLERQVARRLGKEAGLFVSSGTQGNLVAVLSHCQRGDEYVTGSNYHVYAHEGGGAAVLGGVTPWPLPLDDRGLPDAAEVTAAVKPVRDHCARTRLLCLENTFQGRPFSSKDLAPLVRAARQQGLQLHLDGSRLFNAAVALSEDVASIAAGFDSVTLCLSKGLAAPVGAVLCASESVVQQARRWRKVLGGGMRQAGVLAAAGLVAMEDVGHLQEDHHKALRLAQCFTPYLGAAVTCHTNMVFLDLAGDCREQLQEQLRANGVRVGGYGRQLRLVTHQDISWEDIAYIEALVPELWA